MRSGWFWGTPMWQEYLQEYAKTRPECLNEWKTSPLANDHGFTECMDEPASVWTKEEHLSQVIDLRAHKWSDVRKSYRNIINKALKRFVVRESHDGVEIYKRMHSYANGGQPRNDSTYALYQQWIYNGIGMLVLAMQGESCIAGAYWVVFNGAAYYGSGASLEDNIQHAVIWKSLELLKGKGVLYVDMGCISGDEAISRGIFKTGFGGSAKPFTIVRRK